MKGGDLDECKKVFGKKIIGVSSLPILLSFPLKYYGFIRWKTVMLLPQDSIGGSNIEIKGLKEKNNHYRLRVLTVSIRYKRNLICLVIR